MHEDQLRSLASEYTQTEWKRINNGIQFEASETKHRLKMGWTCWSELTSSIFEWSRTCACLILWALCDIFVQAPASQWIRESDRKVVIFGCFRLIVMMLNDVQLRCCFVSGFFPDFFHWKYHVNYLLCKQKGIKIGQKLNHERDDAIEISQLTIHICRSVSIFTYFRSNYWKKANASLQITVAFVHLLVSTERSRCPVCKRIRTSCKMSHSIWNSKNRLIMFQHRAKQRISLTLFMLDI